MNESAAPAPAEVATLAGTAHMNSWYPPDANLIRVRASGDPGRVTAAIARHITESGSVVLELPDGQLTVVLHLDGKTWIARPGDQPSAAVFTPPRPAMEAHG
jgi:hypothetical protein